MTEKSFECQICYTLFKHKSTLALHQLSHSGIKTYKCNQCFKSFALKSDLVRHVRIHTGEKPYQCNFCDKSFALKSNCIVHERKHTGEKPYQCNFCYKSFVVKRNLVVHESKHTGDKPYQCNFCDQRFSQTNSRNYHERIHTEFKAHKCNHCRKSFSLKGNLVIHERILRTHTRENTYQCKFCDERFALKSKLMRHVRIHTGEKPYQCNFCVKSFAVKSNCVVHERKQSFAQMNSRNKQEITHNREKSDNKKYFSRKYQKRQTDIDIRNKVFKCHKCNKYFKQKSILRLHMLRHKGINTEEKPYQSSHCDMRFIKKLDMKKHKRIHSGEKTYKYNGISSAQENILESNFVQCIPLNVLEIKMQCIICEYYLKHKDLMGDQSYQCIYCIKEFCCELHLLRHKQEKHNTELVSTDMNQQIEPKPVAVVIDNDFDNKFIGVHMKVNTEEHLIDNEQNTNITQHDKLKILVIKIQCIICEHYTSCEGEILIYKNLEIEKLYQCSNCVRKFCCELHLVRHSKLHTTEKTNTFCEIKEESFVSIKSEINAKYDYLNHNFEDVYREVNIKKSIDIEPYQKYGNNENIDFDVNIPKIEHYRLINNNLGQNSENTHIEMKIEEHSIDLEIKQEKHCKQMKSSDVNQKREPKSVLIVKDNDYDDTIKGFLTMTNTKEQLIDKENKENKKMVLHNQLNIMKQKNKCKICELYLGTNLTIEQHKILVRNFINAASVKNGFVM